jgi:UDP-N-acetylglucosamine 4,6-dehydratase/5-epimerase
MINGKTVLITGTTGTWGQELTRQLLCKGAEKIVIFSRGEAAQVTMKQKFNDRRLRFILGDVRDHGAIMEACRGINYVFHTCALKHVTKCEQQPREAIKTNIDGTQNVIDACIKNNVDVCVYVSTDKVCQSTCVYGHTKSIAESLISEANNLTLHTDFFSVRSGNIFASSGSVIPIWKKMIKDKNILSITDPDMTRFFITIKDAVKLTLKAMKYSDRGEVFVLRAPAFSLNDIAKIMVKRHGNKLTEVKQIGVLPGERLVEWLFTQEESFRLTKTRDFFIIYPSIEIQTAIYPEAQSILKYSHGYRSVDNLGNIKKLTKMFKECGY